MNDPGGMTYAGGMGRLADLRARIAELRREMRAVQSALTPEPVRDHGFVAADGPVRLSELFGDKDNLFVVHNMGAGCPNCTLWADGYNGVYHHLASRAAFVVASPDAPDRQHRLASARGWRFPMVSDADLAFAAAMGYVDAHKRPLPGVSVFRRQGEAILRVSDAGARPLDDLCVLWHLFELLPGGAGAWKPEPSEEAKPSGTSSSFAN